MRTNETGAQLRRFKKLYNLVHKMDVTYSTGSRAFNNTTLNKPQGGGVRLEGEQNKSLFFNR